MIDTMIKIPKFSWQFQPRLNPTLKLNLRFNLEFLLAIAIGLGVVLRILLIDQREFWYDEVLSLLIAAGNRNAYLDPAAAEFPVLLSDYTALFNLPIENNVQDFLQNTENLLKSLWGEPHPPLFYLGQHLWLQWFGQGVAATRSLNALLSIGTILSSYGLGKVVLGHRGGLLLAALIALNPFFLFHSLNARMYCPVVLWTTLSAWALLTLIRHRKSPEPIPRSVQIRWNLCLILAVACGLMTFYLFACFVLALGVLAVFLERKRSWRSLLPIVVGVLLTLPWMVWGLPRQLSNADLDRFGLSTELGTRLIQHLTGFLSTLGHLLILGDWGADLSLSLQLIAGVAVAIIMGGCILSLARQQEYPSLATGAILGIFPVFLALGLDLVNGNLTLSWGAGRSVIFILPGCLLLLGIWMELTAGRWRVPAVLGLLLLYGTVSIGDYTLRQRTGMATVSRVVNQDITQPTLIAMSARDGAM